MNRILLALPLGVACVTLTLSASDEKPPADYPIVFSERTKEAGILDAVDGMMGHGAAWGDFDGDGRVDLYVGGFCDRPDAEYKPAMGPVPNRLFRNLGNGQFELSSKAKGDASQIIRFHDPYDLRCVPFCSLLLVRE